MGHQDLVDAVVQNSALLLGVVLGEQLCGDLLFFFELEGVFAGGGSVRIFVLNDSHNPLVNVLENIVVQVSEQMLASNHICLVNVELSVFVNLKAVFEILIDDGAIEFLEVFELGQDQVFLVFAIEKLQQVGLVLGDLDDVLVQVSLFISVLGRQSSECDRRLQISFLAVPNIFFRSINECLHRSLHHATCQKCFPIHKISLHITHPDDAISKVHVVPMVLTKLALQHRLILTSWNHHIVEVHLGSFVLKELQDTTVREPGEHRVMLFVFLHVVVMEFNCVVDRHDEVEFRLAHLVVFLGRTGVRLE